MFYAAVDCGFLAPPLFGSVELKQVNQTSLGAVANYACLRGYQLLGNSSRTCLANGEWSSMEPLCEGKLYVHSEISKHTRSGCHLLTTNSCSMIIRQNYSIHRGLKRFMGC